MPGLVSADALDGGGVSRRQIAVIGTGTAGTMVAIRFLAHAAPAEVFLIDPDDGSDRGWPTGPAIPGTC
jgi:uncharacterized NAD(P)/FAD-binding protein YdhS